jgi:hypothetical protein
MVTTEIAELVWNDYLDMLKIQSYTKRFRVYSLTHWPIFLAQDKDQDDLALWSCLLGQCVTYLCYLCVIQYELWWRAGCRNGGLQKKSTSVLGNVYASWALGCTKFCQNATSYILDQCTSDTSSVLERWKGGLQTKFIIAASLLRSRVWQVLRWMGNVNRYKHM